MAKPIKNTPILYGQDAIQFRKEISTLPSIEERRKERKRIEASVEELYKMIKTLPR